VTASRTPRDPSYVNVRSEDCSIESSVAATERGLRVVMYRGERYLVVGVYVARGHNGLREFEYILRPLET
jgi:hypothetical protein